MSIKIRVIAETKITSYPCLKIDDDDGLIVIFTSLTQGIVMYCPAGQFPCGHYELQCDPDLFSNFNGLVTLFNE
jgi:hypothetical protein